MSTSGTAAVATTRFSLDISEASAVESTAASVGHARDAAVVAFRSLGTVQKGRNSGEVASTTAGETNPKHRYAHTTAVLHAY
jgi:hypothetical protein